MRKRWLYSIVTGLVVSVISPAFSQISGGSISTLERGTFNLAEAYPCTAGTYTADLGIANPQTFCGFSGTPATFGAVPGLLCLQRINLQFQVSSVYRME